MFNYSKIVMDHFQNPHNVGTFSAENGVFHAKVGNRNSGAVIELYIRVKNQQITAAKFKAYGCVATIATCSWLTEWLVGKSLREVLTLTSNAVMQVLELPLVKRHVVILMIEALKKIVESVYESESNKRI